MKYKLEIYALSVCFASVVCLIITAGIGGYSIFRITIPEITMKTYDFDKHQTNDAFREEIKPSCSKSDQSAVRPSDDELPKQRVASYEIEIESEKREGFQTLLRTLIYIIVSGFTLFIPSKIAQNARQ